MKKPSFTKSLWIVVPLVVVSSLAALFYSAALRKEPAADAPRDPVATKTLPSKILMLMEAARMGNGAAVSTPEQEEEEARIDQEQIETATAWLGDFDPEQRVAGAEQLAAYPTPEAERRLVKSLANDPDPEVRIAAAQSLDSFEKLDGSTVQALLTALEDPDESVRQTTLGTLQNVHDRLEGDGKNKAARKILARLKKQSKSSHIPKEMRKEITDYLRDLS